MSLAGGRSAPVARAGHADLADLADLYGDSAVVGLRGRSGWLGRGLQPDLGADLASAGVVEGVEDGRGLLPGPVRGVRGVPE